MLIRVVNGVVTAPYNIKSLYREYPNTSFPRRMNEATLQTYGIYYTASAYPESVVITEIDPDTGTSSTKIVVPTGFKLKGGEPLPVDGKWTITYVLIAETANATASRIQQAKLRAGDNIRQQFKVDSALPVTFASVEWHGGMESAIKLDSAKRLNEEAGLSEVTFFDTSNMPHVLTFPEATAIIIAVAYDYQTKFAAKQAALVVALA